MLQLDPKTYLCEIRSSSPSTYKDIGIDYMFLHMNVK